jgi:hypothetical protein
MSSTRVYTSIKGRKVHLDDLRRSAEVFTPIVPKTELVQKAQAEAKERQEIGLAPAVEQKAPIEHTTVSVTKKPKKVDDEAFGG